MCHCLQERERERDREIVCVCVVWSFHTYLPHSMQVLVTFFHAVLCRTHTALSSWSCLDLGLSLGGADPPPWQQQLVCNEGTISLPLWGNKHCDVPLCVLLCLGCFFITFIVRAQINVHNVSVCTVLLLSR